MSSERPYVIIVGAGPSGLLLALLLARQNVPVLVVESSATLDQQPRATHYGPPAVRELRRAGVIDQILREGFTMKEVCWRKIDGTYLAGLNTEDLKGHCEDTIAVLPLQRVAKIILDHLEQQPSARVSWGHNVVDIGQDSEKAWVVVEAADGQRKLEADYVVGCDGANSQVRRCLFGNEFPGKTWDEQIVATNTYYDIDKFGWSDSSFIIHPEHYFMAARISKDGMWRITYGDTPGLSREELIARQPAKFEAFLPGHPKPGEYKVVNISPYKIHQRIAPRMRVGRFLLAADAGHLCNPFGGLGLTGGICDVGGLADCLIGLHQNVADDSILDVYDQVRRQKWIEIIDPISSANIVRLFGQDPEKAMENDGFLQKCKEAATDKELSRQMQLSSLQLLYDFTQHYHGKERGGAEHLQENTGIHASNPVPIVAGIAD